MHSRLLACLLILFSAHAFSEDLGSTNKGIAKPDADARETMKNIIRQKEKTGEVAQYWNNYRDKSIEGIKHPAPLGVASNYAVKTQMYDLRFVIPQDYKDQNGKVIAAKGTVIEPLKMAQMKEGLIFIDGRDPAQVNYAIREGRKAPLKIVLTAGSAYDLRVKYKGQDWRGSPNIPFYFDQKKMIINQLNRLYNLNISSVPAKLTQQGTQMRVDFGMESAK